LLRRCLLVVATVLAIGGPLAMPRAEAGNTVADLAAMTNADRAAAGLRALATANDLQTLAQSRANEQARNGALQHTTNLGSKVTGWKRLGENVGRGPNLRDIETAFMASPSHRENILEPDFTQFGVGVTWDGKQYFYVAVIFRQPSGTAAAPAPAPAPTTTTTRATPPTTRAAAAPVKPKPTTTTTAPPTTTTTLAPAPPPPVEVAAAAVPPPPVETTTTTAPRPIFTNPDFLAANFSGPPVPVAITKPLPGRPLAPIFLAAVMGLVVGSACTLVALQQGAGQLASEWVRLRHWR
jgi:hypothetical protein